MSDSVIISKPSISLSLSAPNITVTDTENSYAYPILSQTTSYRTGDEGWQIANVWNAIYGQNNFDRRNIIGLSDFYTLESNNQFGNTFRFTKSDGSQATFNDPVGTYFIDHYQGIGFAFVGGNQSWNDSIDDILEQSYNGFDDWLPMPLQIVYNLMDYEKTQTNSLNDAYADNRTTRHIATSYFNNTGSCYFYRGINLLPSNNGKDINNAGRIPMYRIL